MTTISAPLAAAEPYLAAKSAILLVIDALRYDLLADPTAHRRVAPNLARWQSADFCAARSPMARPASSSRRRSSPRPTRSARVQVGVGNTGYERGFDTIRNAFDYRVMVEQRITKTLSYELDLRARQHIVQNFSLASVTRQYAQTYRDLTNLCAVLPA